MVMNIILELIQETKHAMIDLPNDVEITKSHRMCGMTHALVGLLNSVAYTSLST